jgi:transcriptional regulator with XRE-family HTH domain
MPHDPGLPERIAAWRAYRDLTLQQIEQLCGGSPKKQTLSLVEHGERDMTVETLSIVVRKAFKTTLRDFFGDLPTKAAA